MTIRRVKLHWIIGALFAVIFIILMTVRLGILEKGERDFREDLTFRDSDTSRSRRLDEYLSGGAEDRLCPSAIF